MVAGGVGANKLLRETLERRTAEAGAQVSFPPLALCTDNGAMIAFAAALKYPHGADGAMPGFSIFPRWELAAAAAQSTPRR